MTARLGVSDGFDETGEAAVREEPRTCRARANSSAQSTEGSSRARSLCRIPDCAASGRGGV